jgi:hypothetical protein
MPSAKQLIAGAIDDAISRGSVEWESVTRRGGAVVARSSNFAERNGGTQLFTFPYGTAQALVIGSRVYSRASSPAVLERFFGWPAGYASRYAGRWVSYTSGDTPYDAVRAGVTITSLTAEWKSGTNAGTVRRVRVAGRATFAVTEDLTQQGATGSETLYISAGPQPLLLSGVVHAKDGLSGALTFGHWGRRITLTAPKQYVACPSIFSATRTL